MENPIEKGVSFVKSNPLKALALAGVGVLGFMLIGRGGNSDAENTATGYTLVGSANIAPEAQLDSATNITLARVQAGAELQALSMSKDLQLAQTEVLRDVSLAEIDASKSLGLATQANYAKEIDASREVELFKTSTYAQMTEKALAYEDKANQRMNETAALLGTQDYEKTKLVLSIGGKKAAKAMAGAPIDNRSKLEKFGSGLGSVASGVSSVAGVLKGIF